MSTLARETGEDQVLTWSDFFSSIYAVEAFPELSPYTRKHSRSIAADVERLLSPASLDDVADRLEELAQSLRRDGNTANTVRWKLARVRGILAWSQRHGLAAQAAGRRRRPRSAGGDRPAAAARS